MLHFMAIKPGHSESQSCISGSSVSARSGRTRPCSVRNLQPARRLLSVCFDLASRSADSLCSWHTLRAENSLGVDLANHTEKVRRTTSVVAADVVLRLVFAHLVESQPCTDCAEPLRWSELATRPDGILCALRSRPPLPHPRRPPLPGSRTAQSDCSTPPSSPGKLPSRDLLICVGTHASAHAPDSALVRADLRTRERRARAI
jgi:hypothetical protein